MSQRVIEFYPRPTVAPLTMDAFHFLTSLFRNLRFVLPVELINPFSLLVTFLPTLILIMSFFLAFRIYRGQIWKAFVVSLVFVPFSLPGTSSETIVHLGRALFLIMPFVATLTEIEYWGYTCVLVILSILDPTHSFIYFWAQASLFAAEAIDSMLIRRGDTTYAERLSPFMSMLKGFARFGIRSTSLLALFVQSDFTIEFFPSSYWWLSIALIMASIALTWARPWEVKRWLSVAAIASGLWWTRDLEWPSLFLLGILTAEILASISVLTKSWLRRVAFGLAVGLCAWTMLRAPLPQRRLNFTWVHSLPQIMEKTPQASDASGPSNQGGILVLGSGLPLVSHFTRGPVLYDPRAMAVMDENEMVHFLEKNELDHIIVDPQFFHDFWQQWMVRGHDPAVSNYSVISRLLTYNGEAVKTSTMQFPALSRLKRRDLTPRDAGGSGEELVIIDLVNH